MMVACFDDAVIDESVNARQQSFDRNPIVEMEINRYKNSHRFINYTEASDVKSQCKR